MFLNIFFWAVINSLENVYGGETQFKFLKLLLIFFLEFFIYPLGVKAYLSAVWSLEIF